MTGKDRNHSSSSGEVVRDRLLRLNDPSYLAHRAPQVAELEALAASTEVPFDVIEIGSNRGRFAMRQAELRCPGPVLALEWRQKWVNRLSRAAERRGLDNLVCLRADARIALPILARDQSVEALYVLYPDPWWKARHGHRRLIDAPFLELVSRLLTPTGYLFLKTDARILRDHIVEAASGVSSLRRIDPWDWPDERPWVWTHRERQCLREGIATYRLLLGRR